MFYRTLLSSGCLTAMAVGADSASESSGLPRPDLLPTTRKIHEWISKSSPSETAASMKAVTVTVPKANGATFEMVPIPGGEFTIGSPESEAKRGADEGPQKKVKIEPFWMGKLEITWNLYQPFMDNGGTRNKDGTINTDMDRYTSEPPTEFKEGSLVDAVTQPTAPFMPMHREMGEGYSKEYPAIAMTHHAASKFCEWLSAQTGHFYRLPTEAEWEYACRAGTTTAYSFGDDPAQLDEYAWSVNNSEYEYKKVGKKKPNPWGLHDMHGNVSELCLDQYLPDAYTKIKDGDVNPWVRVTKRYPTVVRGGSWNDGPEKLRSAARVYSTPAWKILDPQGPKSVWYFSDTKSLGFRVIRPLNLPSVEEMHLFWNMDGDSE